MHEVERTILRWIASHAAPEIAAALASQLEQLEVSGREFTDGGGVFVALSPGTLAMAVPKNWRASYSAIEGPELHSTELEAGASTTLHLNEGGFISSLEIWVRANDYPTNRHPENFSLAPPSGTRIALR